MRILFVKTSSLGDVIHQCPAASDVRRLVPDARVDWVVEEAFAGIASMHPAVGRVIPVAVRRWREHLLDPGTWREVRSFRRALREARYDCIIDTQGLFKSALIAADARGPKHGFDAAGAREPIASRFYDVVHSVPRNMHAVDRNRMLTAAALGLALTGGHCDYGLVPGNAGARAIGSPHGSPYCVLLSMTSRPDKLWPEANWVEVVKALAAVGRTCLLPWGSGAERERSERIVGAAGSGVVPPAMTLRELAQLFSGAQAVVGVDTGLTHLAVGLGIPSIGLYCASEPALTGLHGGRQVANLGGPGRIPAVQEVLVALRAFG